jgi:hypothetical protein
MWQVVGIFKKRIYSQIKQAMAELFADILQHLYIFDAKDCLKLQNIKIIIQ